MTIEVRRPQRTVTSAGAAFVDAVCARLQDLPSEPSADSQLDVDRLNSRVFRVRRQSAGTIESVVIKRLTPALAEHNELVLRRWLPGLGLAHAAPALLGTVGETSAAFVWQVYEDLGTTVLNGRHPDSIAAAAAVDLFAELHTRAASATVLIECSRHLPDLGMPYFVSNVNEAIAALESLTTLMAAFTATQRLVRERLLERLNTLRDTAALRARLAQELGGPQTLLHGDLWDINTVVISTTEGIETRFIDWDRAGTGQVAYDLSTFLYRFASTERAWILQRYREVVGRAGWHLPDGSDLNLLFDTAECARYANRVIWPAAALLTGGGDDQHRELAEILGWFDALEPVLQN